MEIAISQSGYSSAKMTIIAYLPRIFVPVSAVRKQTVNVILCMLSINEMGYFCLAAVGFIAAELLFLASNKAHINIHRAV